MSEALTWASIGARLVLLLRVWWNDARRWVLVRARARRIATLRRRAPALKLYEQYRQGARMNEAAKATYLSRGLGGGLIEMSALMGQSVLQQRIALEEQQQRRAAYEARRRTEFEERVRRANLEHPDRGRFRPNALLGGDDE